MANLRVCNKIIKYHVAIEANLQRLQLCDSEMLVVANSKLCIALIAKSSFQFVLGQYCVYVRKYHVVIEANLQRLQLCDSEMLVVATSKFCTES